MERRSLLRVALAGAVGLWGQSASAAVDSRRASRVVYHLNDFDKTDFVLASANNHLLTADDSQFRLAVVVHGPALRSFRRLYPFPSIEQGMSLAIERGAEFFACANTLAADTMTLEDLLVGFKVTPRGGVAHLADLQAQGWAYLRL